MNTIKLALATLVAGFLIFASGCRQVEIENRAVLNELYKIYKNGSISQCQYDGELVYSAGYNAYDAGGSIYDQHGNQIGTCNYAWGPVDEICKELEGCEILYRVENHLTGRPAVDIYGLAD